MGRLGRWLRTYARASGLQLPLIAQGISKITVVKKQTGLGVPAVGAGGQILRRETSVFTKGVATFDNTELVSHRQDMDSRQGLQSISGKLTGLLSPATYKLLVASSLRKDFVAGINSTALTNVTAAVTSGASGTFTRAAGSYLTDGFKRGDVVTWAGWTTTGVPNNAHNMVITSLTATVMTVTTLDGVAIGPKAAGDSVTATVKGKKTLAPLTGHTNDYFTFEEFYQDLGQSEMFTDVKVNTLGVDIPATGNIKVSFDLMGLARTRGVVQQLTAPATETTTGVLAAVTKGFLTINGVVVGNVTGLSVNVAENLSADGPVIGTNQAPDLAVGKIQVSGQFTAFFQDGTLSDLFDQESTVGLIVVSTADSTPGSDFVGFSLGRIKVFSDTPDDGEKAVTRTFSYKAAINSAGGTALQDDQTILSIQDSAA